MAQRIDDVPTFGLTLTAAENHSVLAVSGELDVAHADVLATALDEAFAQGAVRLDLAALSFMDSTGVRLLDTLLRNAERENRTWQIAPELQPAVRRVLELTGMLELLPFAAVPQSGTSAGERR